MRVRRRMRRRVVWLAIWLTILGVAFVAYLESQPGAGRKQEANRISSPWDRSAAPPPYIEKSKVRMQDPKKVSVKGNAKKSGQG